MILLIVILHYVNKKGAAVNSAENRAEGQHGLTVIVSGEISITTQKSLVTSSAQELPGRIGVFPSENELGMVDWKNL